MATAMVALTFGLARMVLEEEISNFAIWIGALAVDTGLIVLVARTRTDLYRIVRVLLLLSCLPTLLLAFIMIFGWSLYYGLVGCVLLALGGFMIERVVYLCTLIAKARKAEDSCGEAPIVKASDPSKKDVSASDGVHYPFP